MQFFKYQGAGNDFILFDARQAPLSEAFSVAERQWLCNRRFGIGADGLMLLKAHPQYDFEMIYYNADGRLGSMCGNGGRCIVAFAKQLGIERASYRFLASDGPHEATIQEDGEVALSMQTVRQVEALPNGDFVLDTGSPHYICYVEDLDALDIVPHAHSIRYGARFKTAGINVNFLSQQNGKLHIRTYERGVEDETLACGTGVTAAAITLAIQQQIPSGQQFNYQLQAQGGLLSVEGRLTHTPEGFGAKDLWLKGPATLVFQGDVHIPSQGVLNP